MNARFEAMEKRFEAMEKRFSFMQWFIGLGFIFTNFLIAFFSYIAK